MPAGKTCQDTIGCGRTATENEIEQDALLGLRRAPPIIGIDAFGRVWDLEVGRGEAATAGWLGSIGWPGLGSGLRPVIWGRSRTGTDANGTGDTALSTAAATMKTIVVVRGV